MDDVKSTDIQRCLRWESGRVSETEKDCKKRKQMLDDAARGIFWEVEGEVKGGNQCIDDCQTDDGLQPTKDDRGKMACS